MVSQTPCEDLIEDPVVRDLLVYVRNAGFSIVQKKNGEWHCGDLHFAFHFPFRETTIQVLVERHGDRIVRRGQVKPVEDLNAPDVREFLNEIDNPANQFIPGVITEENATFVVIRGDIEIDDTDLDRNRIRFLETLLRLHYQLEKGNPKFYAP